MNETSLVGRPLHGLVKSIVSFAEKRGVWSGPLTSSSPELARLWSAPSTSTGMGVDETSAFTYSVFWACVNNISTDVASFPLILYKTLSDGGKEPLRDHQLFPLLHDAPNPEMTAFTFRGLLTSNALTWGMGYAEIIRNGAGRVVELWPITPDRVTIQRNTYPPYSVYYEVSRQDGTVDRLFKEQMFVLPGATHDGVCGRNIVNMARESIGLGLAAERFGGTFFGNGSTFGGVFEHPGRMTEQAIKNFKASVNTQHQGVEKAHKFIVVEENMKFQKLGVDPNAAQFLETRQHQVEELCRWFRMPPHKVQHLIRTSYNSVEQMNIEYSTDTLTPWCVRWEQELKRQLIAPSERRIQFFKHNMDSKLRGDSNSRGQFYSVMRNIGAYSADDVREKEDMNPLPNGQGKIYLVPQNMAPADRLDEIVDKQVAPEPKPVVQAPAAKDPEDEEKQAARMVEAVRKGLGDVEARIADHASARAAAEAQIGTVSADNEALRAEVETHRSQEQAAREEGARLRAVLLLAQERADRLEAEKDAERLASEELQRAVDAAHAEAEQVKALAAKEVAREQAQGVELTDVVRQLRDEMQARDESFATKLREAITDSQRAAEALAEAERAKAATADEVARVQAELQAMAARATQVEVDHQVMHQTVVAADVALQALRADLMAAEALYAETSTALQTERGALEAARAQVIALQEAIIQAQQERDAVEADRIARLADAATSAAAADEAHRIAREAAAKLEQATAEAEAARQLLAEEAARVTAEREAHGVTQRALETVSTATSSATLAAEAAKQAAELAAREAAAARAQAEQIASERAAQLEAERTARAEAETALALALAAEEERQQKLNIAIRRQVEYEYGAQVNKEIERVRRNKLNPSKLRAWAQDFYVLHEENCIDALRPCMRTYLANMGSTVDVDAYTRAKIHPQVEIALAQLRAVCDGDAEEYPEALERLLTKWEQERPTALADLIQQEAVTHV